MIFSSCYSYNNFLKSKLWMNPNDKMHPKVWIRLEDTLKLMKYLIWKQILESAKLRNWHGLIQSSKLISFINPQCCLLKGHWWKMSDGNLTWFCFFVKWYILFTFYDRIGLDTESTIQVTEYKKAYTRKCSPWLLLQEIR